MKKKWYFINFDQKGISLAEILITLVIVGVLTVIGIPHYLKSQRKAKQNEAKTLLVKLYASERTFIAEWGYGTPNFHQLGFFPRGNYFYNAGWDSSSVKGDNVNKVNGSVTIADYKGPYLPSDLNRKSLGYNDTTLSTTDLEDFTNVKEICKDSVFKGGEAPCIFNPSATSNFDIPAKFGTYLINVDNTKSPDPTKVEFGIGATARFEGASQNDQWYIDKSGRLKNVQSGL